MLCRRLLAGSRQQRQQGLTLLVQFASPLLAKNGEGSSAGGRQQEQQQQQWQGIQQDASFWPLLRACLCDQDAACRKRATHMLLLALLEPNGACHLPC